MSALALLHWPYGAARALALFVPWYAYRRPARIVRTYLAYAHAFLEIFSLWFLIRTLLKPWKNVVESYPQSFLDVEKVLQAFFVNFVTRFVGALVRLCMIIAGVTVQVMLLVWFSVYLGMWLAFPVITLVLLVLAV